MGRALVIVDFQNDFTPGGALGVPDGDAIAGRIEALARSRRVRRSWSRRATGTRPTTARSPRRAARGPLHCVQDTPGAELHAALDRALVDVVVDKGQDPATEGYSGFEATGLETLLRERGVDDVTIVGLATDYCVKNTALDALRHGFGVTVDSSAVRPVDVRPGDGERALDEVRAAGGRSHAVTGSSRGLGLSPRPTFAHGRPSTITTSAV